MKKNIFNRFIYVALILIFIFSLINVYFINVRIKKMGEAKEIAKEILRPAQLEIIKIVPSNCKDCFDIEKSSAKIKNQNVNITGEEVIYFESDKAKDIIKSYNLLRIPAILIKGEINKSDQLLKFFDNNGIVINNETAIYSNINPPYYDIKEEEVVGRVKVINLIDSSCNQCKSLSQVENSLANAGVAISEIVSYEYNSNDGKELISKHSVTRIPAILISEDVDYYESVKKELTNLAGNPKNNYYAIHSVLPPYRDVKEDRILGLVNIILLSDISCDGCYDVRINKNVVERFGIAIEKVDPYDISSDKGKAIIAMYKITKIPTLLVSPEADVYASFVQVWDNVGTVEDDGWYVLRKPEVLGAYKDLIKNIIVKQQVQQSRSAQ